MPRYIPRGLTLVAVIGLMLLNPLAEAKDRAQAAADETEASRLIEEDKVEEAVALYTKALREYQRNKDYCGMLSTCVWLAAWCRGFPPAHERETYCSLGLHCLDELEKKHIKCDVYNENRRRQLLNKRAIARWQLGDAEAAVADAVANYEAHKGTDLAAHYQQQAGIICEAAGKPIESNLWSRRSKQERIEELEERLHGPLVAVTNRQRPTIFEMYALRGWSVPRDLEQQIETACEHLPSSIRTKLTRAGYFILVMKNATDISPSSFLAPRGWEKGTTYSHTQAYFGTQEGAVILSERYIDQSGGVTFTTDAEDCILHEVGHAVDHYLQLLSSSYPFWKAYQTDTGSLSDTERQHLEYFLQKKDDAGMSEAFAESFALLYKNNSDKSWRDKLFQSKFPHVMKVVDDALKVHFDAPAPPPQP